MEKKLRNILVVLSILGLAAFVFVGNIKADESGDLAQDLANEGINQDAMNELLSGPGDTLGERAQNMLNNGSITQGQYDKIYNNVMNLPEEKRQALKNAYDKGYGNKIYDRAKDKDQEQMSETSKRDHIKDLKQQGLSREEIKDKLKSEKKENIKNKRDNASQHELDKAHEKYQDKTDSGNRRDHAKDRSGFVKDKPRLKEGAHNQKSGVGKRGR